MPDLRSLGFLPLPSQVTFTEEDLPRDDEEYILGYYSNNMNSIVGVSSPIKVKTAVRALKTGILLPHIES